MSLLAWYTHPTADEWAAFAAKVAGRMAPYVDAWSPMNEPNWPGMAPATPIDCEVISGPGTSVLANRHGRLVVRRWRKVPHGTHRWNGARLLRSRSGHWRLTTRPVRRVRSVVLRANTPQGLHDCGGQAYAVGYRSVYRAVTPIIHRYDPTALIVAGDIAPADPRAFMSIVCAGGLRFRPDVISSHPYSMWGRKDPVRGYVRWARARGAAFWITEWGCPPTSSSAAWVRDLSSFRRAGVAVTFLYDTAGSTWDTRLRDGDVDAVAAWARTA